MCSGVRDQRVGKFLSNFLIKPSEFLKKVHPICSCEYVHYLGMCMEPGGVGGLLPHKTSYNFVYDSLGNQMWRRRQQFLKKNRETDCVFFKEISRIFFISST